jgi:hypothetical protein
MVGGEYSIWNEENVLDGSGKKGCNFEHFLNINFE